MSNNQPTIKQDRILVIDYGSQYSQLIARRVREAGVFCEMYPYDIDSDRIKDFGAKGVILSGGPESVHDENSPKINQALFDLEVPILGICYGMQAMADHFGGEVKASDVQEFGAATIDVTGSSTLLDSLEDEHKEHSRLHVWMSHGDKVVKAPEGFEVIASTPSCPIAVMVNEDKKYYGLQFHPEVTHTLQGDVLLSRFVHQVCDCAGDWTPDNIIDMRVDQLKQQIGDKQVLLGLSGGVDSSVVAALLHKAIGDQLTCVFVDNGLLRLHEGDQVMQVFAENMGVKVVRVDAEDRFLDALAGESDPEAKRKIIGKTFIDVFADAARDISQGSDGKPVEFLAQGTIYPDVIESAKSHQGKAHVIKSHHNVGGLPDDLQFELVEPLRDLFKDEVRKLGIALGLPHKMIYRHPFPGPGLGVRILGEVKKEYADILRQADAIFMQELEKSGWYEKTAQAFAVFTPVKSVGVVGDGRRYAWVIALRAVETIDFMTARFAHLPYELIETVSNRIMNEIKDVSRVTYDVSSKPPATIEWE
ncbi:glutamine-hydrolyzing GMP synthase [Psychrobacter sp. FDAARGOS_221]|uniref:glutamine-hydrolyzing GMP synthase n=1 Tax=Psychrobacter sp. FDAARGOS_221 TaxID=1975705 RepID=UPI000BB534FA|nr:glutamine-hydrolyzing GMP synthase [Psychrobacter sp. FDAARGOS_221]PNK60785.1 glutamine-hydrolyzing GMP synthase [Psychrobacter sp. FDAARGOS_221]